VVSGSANIKVTVNPISWVVCSDSLIVSPDWLLAVWNRPRGRRLLGACGFHLLGPQFTEALASRLR
jgi:hypothetical protein